MDEYLKEYDKLKHLPKDELINMIILRDKLINNRDNRIQDLETQLFSKPI